jgi:serine/threonine protein kinase
MGETNADGLMKKGFLLKGRFRIERLLGQGRAGTTYLAEDTRKSRRCVVKHLSLLEAREVKDLSLPAREARILSQLNHLRIPGFVDYIEDRTESDVNVYLIHEYIEGKSLAELIGAGRHYTERQALELAVELVDVLEYLHGFSPPVLHRNIKPGNVVIGTDGSAFLIDFSAVQEVLHQRDPLETLPAETHGYPAPEQFIGGAAPASDIYSLGMTLIYLLSHVEPSEILRQGKPPDFRPHVNISEGLARVLDRMTEPAVGDRYRDVRELRQALETLLNPPAVSGGIKRKRLLAAAGLFLTLISAVMISQLGRQSEQPSTHRAPASSTRLGPASREPIQSKPSKREVSVPLRIGSGKNDPAKILIPFDGGLEAKGLTLVKSGKREGETRFAPGKSGKSVHLVDTGLEYVTTAETEMIFKGSYTVELWFQVDGGALAVAEYLPVLRSALWTVDVRDGGTSHVFIHSENGGHFSWTLHDKQSLLTPGTWVHLAITRDAEANDFHVFLNGRPFGHRKAPFKVGSDLDVLRIGSTSGLPGRQFRGKLDELAVYDYARSPDQLASDASRIMQKENFPVIRGHLLYDRQPVTTFTSSPAKFWLRNESTGKEQQARVEYRDGHFEMSGLPPGRYGMDVRIRTDTRGRAGDLIAWKTFSVMEGGSEQELPVDLHRIIHLTSPQDNNQGMLRWHSQCEGKMSFTGPVKFAWEPVGEGLSYVYVIERYRCEPFQRIETVSDGMTRTTEFLANLPSSGENEFYLLRLTARSSDLLLGRLETYGINGGRGWDYRFRVD